MAADVFALTLLLLAAVLHAAWNAVTKGSGEPLLGIWLVTLSGGLTASAFMPFVSFPAPAAWPYLAGSLLLHLAYQLFLAFAYRRGDLSQVYPIARGVAPCVVTGMAAVYAGEPLTPGHVLGVALVSGSLASLGFGTRSRATTAAVSASVATGLLIGTYTFVDAQGVRLSRDPFDFIVWSLTLDAIPITLAAVSLRARLLGAFVRAQLWRGVGGGAMATLAYGIVLWAMSRSPMAGVAAVRETSVIFAALIGTRLLGEPFGTRRVLASAGVAAGIGLLAR